MEIILYLLIILFGLALIYWEFLLFFSNSAPFLSTPHYVLPYILENVSLTNESKFYELGGGNSHVLFEIYKKFPYATYYSMDHSVFAYLVSWLKWLLAGRPHNVHINLQDFLKQDLSPATHIYVWLSATLMDKLLPKLEKELKPGTQLIALDFHFTSKKETHQINLGKSIFGHTLYVYQF